MRGYGVGNITPKLDKYGFSNAKITHVQKDEVIRVEVTRGTGTDDDPVTCFTQFWTLDGYFIAEKCIIPKVE